MRSSKAARGDPKGNAGRTAFSLGSLLRLELDLEVCQQGFATMRAFIRLYVSRSLWIIMVVGGVHATTDCLCAQHEIFDANVMEKWKAYEDFSHGLQGSVRSQTTRNGKLQEAVKHYKQNRECALLIVPHNRDPLLSMCALANSHYRATIDLSKSDPSNAILEKYTPLSSNTETFTPSGVVFFETSRHFAYSKSSSLRQAVSNPSFKVTKAAKEIQNGQELVRVDYIYNYVMHRADQDHQVRSQGSLWLDPSRCWCIRRLKSLYETTIRGERSYHTEEEVVCETIDHPSGFPILKSRTDRFKMIGYKSKQKIDVTSKIDYDLEVNDRVPDSEFTLSAFGLPEPEGETVKKPIPLYVWIFIGAGVCVMLALGFRYLARRARLKQVA
jgi:hypothetical protein